jgi:hypothetical protein
MELKYRITHTHTYLEDGCPCFTCIVRDQAQLSAYILLILLEYFVFPYPLTVAFSLNRVTAATSTIVPDSKNQTRALSGSYSQT